MASSPRGMPLDTAAIMSTVLEGIFYGNLIRPALRKFTTKLILHVAGFSLLMFCGTLWALGYRRSSREINRRIAGLATLLLI
ncbi:hypothetical protein HYDPIDRAFT_119423, partial [Hydnomerulius pinastri MD-312]